MGFRVRGSGFGVVVAAASPQYLWGDARLRLGDLETLDSKSLGLSSLFFPERIHEADDPFLTAGEFAVVLPCGILKALPEICHRLF